MTSISSPVRILVVGLAAGWLAPLSLAGFEHKDSFTYPDGSEGEPAWFTTSTAWEVKQQSMTFDGDARSFAILETAPFASAFCLEATVTMQRRSDGPWPLAGVVVRRDDRNYWHLALVEAPAEQNRHHFVELSESLDGQWLAHSAPASRLTPLADQGRNLDWQYNRPYRLRIVLASDRIDGFVADLGGKPLAHLAYKFDNPAVTTGQPALDAASVVVSFDDVHVAVSQTTPALPPERIQYPPYNLTACETITDAPTGFFHTKEIDGRWWLIDPKGRAFYMVGTDHIRYDGHWCQKLGYAPYGRNVQAKYGSEAKWAETTTQRLADWGFNTLPAGHSPSLRHRRFAHIEFISFGQAFAGTDDLCPRTTWTGFPNVFSPKWPRHCDKFARANCAPVRDDPWLIGYFLDNELEWFGKNYQPWGLFDEAWKKPADHSAKKAWIEFLKTQLSSSEEFNTHWKTTVKDWNSLASHTSPSAPATDRAGEIARLWVRRVAEEYFKHCEAAIRRHDPNHLILGCRFAGWAPDIWDIAGRHCDVVSFNQYPRMDVDRGLPQSFIDLVQGFHRQAGKPLMVTEWSFPALDSGLPCKHGAGMRVDTQAQRARCFTHFQTLMFSLPFMIGSNFFMFVDEPALGISETFPEDSNYGLVNERDEPYPDLTQAAARLNSRVYELHKTAQQQSAPKPRKLLPWLSDLPPLVSLPPDRPLKLSTGDLRLEGPVDAIAWRVNLGESRLGDFYPVIHQQSPQNAWSTPDAANVLAVHRNEDVTVLDMEFSRQAALRFRTLWRLWIPARPSGWFATQCLRVENTDSAAWKLAGIFHYLKPAIAGNPSDDEPLLIDVPNYYLRGAAWIDSKARLGIGCWYADDEAFRCHYWKNPEGGFHPDLHQIVDQQLQPGQSYECSGPPAFFYPLRDVSTAGFSKAVLQVENNVLAAP